MPSASASVVGAGPVADFLRIFFGNGTADNPNGGLLIGDGYSWTAESCTGVQACTGGNAGLIWFGWFGLERRGGRFCGVDR